MSRTINTMPVEIQRKVKTGRTEGEFPHNMGWNTGSFGAFRRSLVRQQRSKDNQLVREGRYDEIDPPRRNARWLYW